MKNASYRSDAFGKQVDLRDGIHEEADLHVALTGPIAFGDLNSDGAVDAIVFLETSGGGSGIWRELAVVLNRNGEPVNVATVDLGDRVLIKWARIMNDRVVVEIIEHGPGDPLCCPTRPVRRTYAFAGDKLALLGSALLERPGQAVDAPASAPSNTPISTAPPPSPAKPTTAAKNVLATSVQRVLPAANSLFRVGSTHDEVVAVQGKPDWEDDKQMVYGQARVFVERGHVTSWVDPDARLNGVGPTPRPSSAIPAAAAAATATSFGPAPPPASAAHSNGVAPAATAANLATAADSGVEIVSRAPNTVVRYPVMHQHFSTGCYGYLYFSPDAIWYEVTSPAKNRDHAFREQRSNLKTARQWRTMGTSVPEAELKFRNGTYHFLHVARSTVETAPARVGSDRILPYEDLLQAANRFDAALMATVSLPVAASAGSDCRGAASAWEALQRQISTDRLVVAQLQAVAAALGRGDSLSGEHLRDRVREAASSLRAVAADLDDSTDTRLSRQQRTLSAAREPLNELLRSLRLTGDTPPDLPSRLADYRSAVIALIDEITRARETDRDSAPLALLGAQAETADGTIDVLLASAQLKTTDVRITSHLSRALWRFDRAQSTVRVRQPAAGHSAGCTALRP